MTQDPSSSANTLGARLKCFRDSLFFRQTEMADYLDVSASLYTKLESDRIETSARTLAKIAKKLNTTVEYLKNGEGEAIKSPQAAAVPIANIDPTDEAIIQRIITFALDERYQKLAQNISNTLHLDFPRALAMIIRTILLDNKSMNLNQ